MTVDERMAAAQRRRKDPPLCHCGVRDTLVVPPRGGSPSRRLASIVAQSCIDEAILFAQEGRTCDWEWFSGRDEFVARFRRLGQRDKEREATELRDKIRNKYDVPLPHDELLFGTLLDEYIKEKRCRPPILEAHDTLIKYWRLNRAEKRRKLEEERHLERQVQDRAREAQLEAMRALVGDLPCNMTIRNGALERSSDGFVGMRDAQRDAVGTSGSILRKEKDKGKSTSLRVTFASVEPAINKGKGVVVISSDEDDGWGDDEVLSGCESD
ncbi:hypothetical protein HU200_007639 [Digitaria exilis]|uniref:Uncharacterized protein n=1 Tax=Digitaria exilis TaxID=1010633 RepID=A0A835KQQ5_9POAL|nr:hypothetical protein HU200_007639 [Digitaria exilis]